MTPKLLYVPLDPEPWRTHRIRLDLPVPPTVNRHVRVNWQAKRVFTGGDSGEIKSFKKLVAAREIEPFPKEVWLNVSVKVYFDSLRRDVDGLVKILFDAMEGRCYVNDRQVRRLTVDSPYLDPANPRVVVLIQPYEMVTGRPWVRTMQALRSFLSGNVSRTPPPASSTSTPTRRGR